jgi:hypothetical protein
MTPEEAGMSEQKLENDPAWQLYMRRRERQLERQERLHAQGYHHPERPSDPGDTQAWQQYAWRLQQYRDAHAEFDKPTDPDDETEWSWWARSKQQRRSSDHRDIFEGSTLKILSKNHEVLDLNQGYQYRIDGLIGPTHRRYHVLRTGERGAFGKWTTVEDIERLLQRRT